jgi:hypothetical protein
LTWDDERHATHLVLKKLAERGDPIAGHPLVWAEWGKNNPNQGGTVAVTFPLILKFDDYHEAPFIEKILSQVTGRSIRATELDGDPADPYWYQFRFDLRSGNPISDTLIRGGRKARELAPPWVGSAPAKWTRRVNS